MDRAAIKAEVEGICVELERVGTLPRVEPVRMLCTRRKRKYESALSLPSAELIKEVMLELLAEGRIKMFNRPGRETPATNGYGPINPPAVLARVVRPKAPPYKSGLLVLELTTIHRRRRRWGRILRTKLGLEP